MRIRIKEQTLVVPQEKQEFIRAFLKAQNIAFTIEGKYKNLREIPFSSRVKFLLRELNVYQLTIGEFVLQFPKSRFIAYTGGYKSAGEIEEYLTLLGFSW